MKLSVKNSQCDYEVLLKKGALDSAADFFDLQRKVLIVSDSGVPRQYIERFASGCLHPVTEIFPAGEQSKNMEIYQRLLQRMAHESFTRGDCVAALGGGVCGDMAGFAAATYMRGVDFYNIPTTVLSQVDSSIGGKVGIDFGGYKNMVGAFYAPRGVLIDCELLSTLAERHFANGMAEAVKMAACCDAEFFSFLEELDIASFHARAEEIVSRALAIKKNIVEQDEKETGLRRVLNFGHTFAHALESAEGFGGLLHGECVGLGMLVMAASPARERIAALLQKLDLPVRADFDKQAVIAAMSGDKKFKGDSITVVWLNNIGDYEFRRLSADELAALMEEVL